MKWCQQGNLKSVISFLQGVKRKQNLKLMFVPNELGHSNFGYPLFTKEINTADWPFLDEYRVTKVGLSQFVWNKLYNKLRATCAKVKIWLHKSSFKQRFLMIFMFDICYATWPFALQWNRYRHFSIVFHISGYGSVVGVERLQKIVFIRYDWSYEVSY